MFEPLDPETNLAIISPRVYALRLLQTENGIDITSCTFEQRGVAPITYTHHVSQMMSSHAYPKLLVS